MKHQCWRDSFPDVVTWRDFGLSLLAHLVHPVALLGRIDNRVVQNHGIGHGTDIRIFPFFLVPLNDTNACGNVSTSGPACSYNTIGINA